MAMRGPILFGPMAYSHPFQMDLVEKRQPNFREAIIRFTGMESVEVSSPQMYVTSASGDVTFMGDHLLHEAFSGLFYVRSGKWIYAVFHGRRFPSFP